MFDALIGLFNRVGLQINEGKMTIMACRPYHTPLACSTEDYTQQVTGRGISCRERLYQRVHFPDCGFHLTAGFLAAHWQRQHGVGNIEAPPPPPQGEGGGEIRDRERTLVYYRV